MSIPTSSELALIRTQPHQTQMWLSVFRPTTVLACQVNNPSAAKGDRVVPYDTVSTGSYTNVQADYTALIGSTAGAADIGRIRVRSADASNITFAENSDIAWANDQFITVLKYVDLVPIFPRIIQDPAKATNVIFYKDYDLAYTNQNTVLGTFICATNHKAGFRTDGTYQAYWTSTGSYCVTGETGTFSWQFEGGTPSTFVGPEPGWVSYSATGDYQTTIIVTGATVNDVTYRYVQVRDRPGEGPNPPEILRWELEEIGGSRDEGGHSIKIKAWDAAGFISANDLVVIFADEWFGTTQQNIGGNAKNNSSIKFVGYVVDGSISYNWQESFVEFQVESPVGMMGLKEGFSVSCESKKSPATWFEIADLSVTRAMYHYLRWHSTVLKVCDFQYTGPDYKVQYFDSDRESLKDAIGKFVEMGLRGQIVSDKQGKIWVELSAGATNNPETDFPVALSMSKQDWMGEPQIDERLQKEISYLEYGGIAYSGITTGTFAAMMSGAPGSAPSYVGKPEREQGLILVNQSQLNTLTGNMFAYKNSRFPDIEFVMAGNYANLDIAPIERIQVNMAQTDTSRGIVLNNSPFHINRIAWTYNPANGSLIPTINVAQLVNGVPAETIPIPPQPPDQGFKTPSIQIPAIPAITFPGFDLSGLGGAIGYIAQYNAGADVAGFITWTFIRNIGSSFSLPDTQTISFDRAGVFLITCWAKFNPDTTVQFIEIVTSGGSDWGDRPTNAGAIYGSNTSYPVVSMMSYFNVGTSISIACSDATNLSEAMIQVIHLM